MRFWASVIAIIAMHLTFATGVQSRQDALTPIYVEIDQSLDKAALELHSEPKRALSLVEDALKRIEARAIEDKRIYVKAIGIKSAALSRLGEYTTGLELGERALTTPEAQLLSTFVRTEIIDGVARAHEHLGDVAKALMRYQEGYRLRSEAGDDAGMTSSLTSMAGLYYEVGQFGRAVEYYETALDAARRIDNEYIITRILNNLAYSKIQIGEVQKALELLDEARPLAREIANPLAIAYIHENTGEALFFLGQYDRANWYLEFALTEARRLGLDSLVSGSLYYLGRSKFEQGNLGQAEDHAREGLRIAESNQEAGRIRDLNKLLADVLETRGAHEEALARFRQYDMYKDRVADQETKQMMALLETQFAVDAKEQELELLRRDREIGELRVTRARTARNTALAGAFFMSIAVFVMYLLFREKARANARAESKTHELLKTQAQLEEANKTKSNILAMTSHEVRTPLNGIMGMTQVLLHTKLSPDQRRFIETIHSSGEVLLTILSDILDLAKIEAGKFDIRRDVFPMQSLIGGLTDLWSAKAQEKDLSFIVETDPGLEDCYIGDIDRIRQILFNLVSNAIKFTQKGKVTVRLRKDGEAPGEHIVRFEVSDTGIGIPKDLQKRVFEPFVQAESGAARSFGGTGLGLSICRELAQLMQGDVGVTSADGKGSTFWFVIPCEIASSKKPQGADNGIDGLSKNMDTDDTVHILVAEDNELNRVVIREMLSEGAFSVECVSNGAEATARAAEGGIDVILMDVHMPHKDGLQAVAEIRTLPAPECNVPVIALTADAMEGDKQRVIDAGMDDYISKPIDQRLLLSAIKRQLRRADGAKTSATA